MSLIHAALRKAEAEREKVPQAAAEPERTRTGPAIFAVEAQALPAPGVKRPTGAAPRAPSWRLATRPAETLAAWLALACLLLAGAVLFVKWHGALSPPLGAPVAPVENSARPLEKRETPPPKEAAVMPLAGPAFLVTGIVAEGPSRTAIINGKVVQVGDSVHGARVTAIEENQVIFSSRGKEIVALLH